MKINIAKLKQAKGSSQSFKLEERSQDITFDGENIKFLTPVKAEGEITNSGEMFNLTGNFTTTLVLQCGRCLEEFQLPINSVFDAIFSQKTEDDDIRGFIGDEIIIDDVITEALLLDLPLKFLCCEECKGLCPHCGCDLNKNSCNCSPPIDPRLSVLGNLLNSDDKLKGV